MLLRFISVGNAPPPPLEGIIELRGILLARVRIVRPDVVDILIFGRIIGQLRLVAEAVGAPVVSARGQRIEVDVCGSCRRRRGRRRNPTRRWGRGYDSEICRGRRLLTVKDSADAQCERTNQQSSIGAPRARYEVLNSPRAAVLDANRIRIARTLLPLNH